MSPEDSNHLILSIETSTTSCAIALHEGPQVLSEQAFFLDKSHSSLLPGILQDLVARCGYKLADLHAIAVASGPGSYTGLRIGLSTAKGLCFALNIPLIQVSSLDTLAKAAEDWALPGALICPMIDARRMEVYTKLLRTNGDEVWPIQPLVLEPDTFAAFEDQLIYLIGNGAAKCKNFLQHKQLVILGNESPRGTHLGSLAWQKYQNSDFEDLASYEPNYLKEFQTKKPTNKLLS